MPMPSGSSKMTTRFLAGIFVGCMTSTAGAGEFSQMSDKVLANVHKYVLGDAQSTAGFLATSRRMHRSYNNDSAPVEGDVSNIIASGRWESGWEAVPANAKASAEVVAAAIRKGIVEREEQVPALEDLYQSSAEVLWAAITKGWWENRRFQDIPEDLRFSSGKVVGEAIRVGLPGAPQSLSDVHPEKLRDDEDVLWAGAVRLWFRTWNSLPDAARGSVSIIRGIIESRFGLGDAKRLFRSMRSTYLDLCDDDDRNPWASLVLLPARDDAAVVSSAISAMLLLWRHVPESLREHPVVLRTAVQKKFFPTWNDFPDAARGSVSIVQGIIEGKLGHVQGLGGVELSDSMRWTYRDLCDDDDRNPWASLVLLPARDDAAVVSSAISRSMLKLWRHVPESLREHPVVLRTAVQKKCFPTWNDLPDAARGSVSIVQGIIEGKLGLGGVELSDSLRRTFRVLLRGPDDDRNPWASLVVLPARDDASVVSSAISQGVLLEWDNVPVNAKGHPAAVVAAINHQLISDIKDIPEHFMPDPNGGWLDTGVVAAAVRKKLRGLEEILTPQLCETSAEVLAAAIEANFWQGTLAQIPENYGPVVADAIRRGIVEREEQVPALEDLYQSSAELVEAAITRGWWAGRRFEEIPAHFQNFGPVVAAAIRKGIVSMKEQVPALEDLYQSSAELVEAVISRGWWADRRFEEIPAHFRVCGPVVAAAIRWEIVERKEQVSALEDLYQSSAEVLWAAIKRGWWANRRFEEIPARFQDSDLIVDAANNASLRGAPAHETGSAERTRRSVRLFRGIPYDDASWIPPGFGTESEVGRRAQNAWLLATANSVKVGFSTGRDAGVRSTSGAPRTI